MRNKYLIAALAALMLVAVVATGVHVMNKEAHAIPTYTVECLGWADGNPIEDVTIKFTIVGEQPRFIDTDENGIATTTTATAQAWTAVIIDDEWEYRNLDPHPANCSGPMTVTWGVIAI